MREEEGNWTYVGSRGETVIDYVIGNEDVWGKIEGLEIGSRIDSDHFPIVVRI